METTQYIPPAPPKKSRTKTILLTIAVTVGILWVIGTLIEQNESAPVSTITEVDSGDSLQTDTQLEIMRLVWDTEITATDRANICDYYNTPPVGTTPEMVEIFAEGADMTYAEAEPLLNQLLAEKC